MVNRPGGMRASLMPMEFVSVRSRPRALAHCSWYSAARSAPKGACGSGGPPSEQAHIQNTRNRADSARAIMADPRGRAINAQWSVDRCGPQRTTDHRQLATAKLKRVPHLNLPVPQWRDGGRRQQWAVSCHAFFPRRDAVFAIEPLDVAPVGLHEIAVPLVERADIHF